MIGRADQDGTVDNAVEHALLGAELVGAAPAEAYVPAHDMGGAAKHRDRVGVRLGERGNDVGHAPAVRSTGRTRRPKGGALLMAGRAVLDPVRRAERPVDLQRMRAGMPKK